MDRQEKINGAVDFIIQTVQLKSMDSGHQYIVRFENVVINCGIGKDTESQEDILDELLTRVEVLDAYNEDDGFNVNIFTDYAPNYEEE